MGIEFEYLIILFLLLFIGFQYYRENKKNINNNDLSDKLNEISGLKESQEDLITTVTLLKEATQSNADNSKEIYTLLTKGGAVAGKFGEITLKVILENAGFKKGVNYDEQKGIDGSIPDVIVNLPENKKVIIDSKVSLAHYNEYLKAVDHVHKDSYLQKHINSVKGHLKSLSLANYRSLFNDESLDLVVMFMPVEGAYILACDENIIKQAASEKIAIVGPTTLIAILQIIARAWSSKLQSEATNKIIALAHDIYDKTRLVNDAFSSFEQSLDKANKAVNDGKKRTQNLVNKVEKMRKIGGLEPTKDISDKLRDIDKD